MLVALIGLTLLLQVNSIAGQGYQVYGSPGVQVIYPTSSNVQVLGSRPFFRRGIWEIVRNLTITANATSQDFQFGSSLGNGNIALSNNQNSGNGPLRNLLRNLFGRQPNIQYVNLSGRAFNDRSQEPQTPVLYNYQPFASPELVSRTRVKVVRQGVPRRILVRNLKSSQTQMTNVETYRIPVFEDDWL
uniref:Uncharacterized protein LOC108048397 n=1 Tax=Drosophila rhopaloa TaxID=1041015 RepID=A0A6P4F233_DRORH